jgi:hypothetical protein
MLSWAALEVVSDLGYAQGSVGLRGGMVEKMRSASAEGGTRPLQLNKQWQSRSRRKIKLIPDMIFDLPIQPDCRR